MSTTQCVAAAGAPEEASARRWLQVHGGAVKCVRGLAVDVESGEGVPGCDLAAGRLSALLAGLPALTSIKWMDLRADMHRRPAAAIRAFLAGAARAIARCSSLHALCLHIVLLGGLADQLPGALVRELASVRSLEDLFMSIYTNEANRLDWPAIPSVAHLTADLAALPRLRALTLVIGTVRMEATLPASMSRLAQLTMLSLRGFDGLRCELGWARLPALECLDFCECVFACDGEDALPRMDTLVNLSSYHLWNCPSLRVLPASLWRLPQLRGLHHHTDKGVVTGAARSELPVAGLPLSAPCFASMHGLSLSGHNLPAFPLGILSMACLVYLNLSHSCFEQLPEGVSVLTALEELRLGRHSAGAVQVGGALDARALGGLAGLPNLRELGFANCSVLLCSSFQAAAAHPRLERVQLDTSHPAPGLSCTAFLGFVSALLQRGRPTVLELTDSVVQGAGRRDSRDFRGALRAVGYPLSDSDSADLV